MCAFVKNLCEPKKSHRKPQKTTENHRKARSLDKKRLFDERAAFFLFVQIRVIRGKKCEKDTLLCRKFLKTLQQKMPILENDEKFCHVLKKKITTN